MIFEKVKSFSYICIMETRLIITGLCFIAGMAIIGLWIYKGEKDENNNI